LGRPLCASPDDIRILLDLYPRSDKECDEIEQAMKAGKERGKKEVEECLAKLCAEGNREAFTCWNKTRPIIARLAGSPGTVTYE